MSGQAAGKPIYYVSIDANDIPLDATLEKALPSQYRELYGQLEADGVADVQARVFSTGDANNVGPISYIADVVCRGRSLKAERLPVVLSDVAAELSVSPDSVNIKSLHGWYGQSRVALTGGMRLTGDRKSRQYHAKIAAEEVPFNETTIGLLPKPLAEQLAAFRPQGNVNLRMEIRTPDGNEPPVYAGEVECLGVTIDHPRVAYPLRDVHGTISVTRDKLAVQEHDGLACRSLPARRVGRCLHRRLRNICRGRFCRGLLHGQDTGYALHRKAWRGAAASRSRACTATCRRRGLSISTWAS